MATRLLRPTRVALLLAGVLIISAIALQIFASSAGAVVPIDTSSYRLPAEDRARLIGMTFGEPPREALPATTAERLAERPANKRAVIAQLDNAIRKAGSSDPAVTQALQDLRDTFA